MDPLIKQYLHMYHDLLLAHAKAEAEGDHNLARGCMEEMKTAEVYFIKFFNLKDLKWLDEDKDKEPSNVT